LSSGHLAGLSRNGKTPISLLLPFFIFKAAEFFQTNIEPVLQNPKKTVEKS
jgi:hypothetical protein